jgi:hypothetical protein
MIRVVNKRSLPQAAKCDCVDWGATYCLAGCASNQRPQEVYIGRPSVFGNPFVIGRDGTREDVVEKYREWFHAQDSAEWVRELRQLLRNARHSDLNLVCWCAPQACHGDVIKQYLEGYL